MTVSTVHISLPANVNNGRLRYVCMSDTARPRDMEPVQTTRQTFY